MRCEERSEEVFFLLKKDKLGATSPFLCLVVAARGGDVWRWGRQRGSGEDRLRKTQGQNGKIVSFQ